MKRLIGRRRQAGERRREAAQGAQERAEILKFVPGTAQDVRAYYLVLQYWLSGSAENVANMVRYLAGRTDAGCAGRARAVAEPPEYPEVALYHPDVPGRVTESLAELPGDAGAPRVGLLLIRSYVLAGNTAHYDAVIRALEARGLVPVPAFAAGPRQPRPDRPLLRGPRWPRHG
jgi:magnesium chelatase subunit H